MKLSTAIRQPSSADAARIGALLVGVRELPLAELEDEVRRIGARLLEPIADQVEQRGVDRAHREVEVDRVAEAAISIALPTTQRSISPIEPDSSAAITNSPAGISRSSSTIRSKSSCRSVSPLERSTIRWAWRVNRSWSSASRIRPDHSMEIGSASAPRADVVALARRKDQRTGPVGTT